MGKKTIMHVFTGCHDPSDYITRGKQLFCTMNSDYSIFRSKWWILGSRLWLCCIFHAESTDESLIQNPMHFFPCRLSGEMDIIQELPHTVTSWVGGGFCTNLETGIGVSESTTIKGFQPFFVSLTLPYSMIRNEVINLPVTVFNYLSECLNVRAHTLSGFRSNI